MFPKGSKLLKKLEPTISYYVHSTRFYKLVRSYFGKDGVNFYKRNTMIFNQP